MGWMESILIGHSVTHIRGFMNYGLVHVFGFLVLKRYNVHRVAQQQQTIAFSFVMDRATQRKPRPGAFCDNELVPV